MANTNSGGSDAGRVLNGRYQLISVVGGGGMAQVYKARDNVLGRVVAIKVLREQYATDSQFVERFRREAQAAANLAHPNIVSVYDVGQDGELYYIVMEIITGESLKELITRAAPLPVDTSISFASQILSALEYAHRSGLIHRDIKPQNVLITPQGVAKVTDYGIAKSVSDLGLTEAGLALGTAHYFSPEQAKGERVLPQSDIYAVGVTLYEMLTGRLPFESDSAMGLAYKHINEVPPPPSRFNPNIPPKLDNIVMRALAKETGQRFASATEMEKALRHVEVNGQQATTAIPVARPNIAGGPPRASARGGRATEAVRPTGSLRAGVPRGGYPAGATVGVGAGAGTATRSIASPLAAPTTVAMRPSSVKVQAGGGGCATAAITIFVVAALAGLVALGVWFGPQLASFLTPAVVPSPTNTPVIPTVTRTSTPLPPTLTPTSTSTVTPTPTSTPVSVKVPKLVGLKVGDAKVLAEQSGFVMKELDRQETTQWPQGVVFQQDPQPDSILKKTSTLQVRVSAGPPAFKLPQLANTDPGTAKSTLESAGLKVEIVYEGNPTVPKGVVTRSEPPGDASVRTGDTIRLFVSLGETGDVPDLTGMTPDIATQSLAKNGLVLGTVTEVGRAEVGDDIDKVPPGTVYSQDPGKGTQLEKGGPVNVRLRRKE